MSDRSRLIERLGARWEHQDPLQQLETRDLAIKHIAEISQWPRAWQDVLAERRRHISVEGWTPEHDDEYADGELARAAATYARAASYSDFFRMGNKLRLEWSNLRHSELRRLWPWDWSWWKPTPHDRRRDLEKAGALIVAEIERLDRAILARTTGAPSDA